MNSSVITQLQLSDKNKGRKVVQLDKPKPVTQLAPMDLKERVQEKAEIFVK